jgi:hypothetical protein
VLSEFKNSLSRSLAVQGEMGSALVVFPLPAFESASQLLAISEVLSLVELFLIGLVTAFDFAVHLGLAGGMRR